MSPQSASLTLHASCVIIGESGVLIRGPSGSGKSSLALKLIHHARALHRFAALVSDDRTCITPYRGQHTQQLIARPHPALVGLIERRGTGLVKMASEPAARLTLILDLQKDLPPRLPEATDTTTDLAGFSFPRVLCSRDWLDPAFAALGLDLGGGPS